MAASGIQEHNEARRKERVLMKKATMDKRLRDMQIGDQPQLTSYGQNTDRNNNFRSSEDAGSSYEREVISRRVGSPPGLDGTPRDAKAVDRQRRMDHYHRQQSEYSAKINGRYRNFDYLSQW